PAVRHGQPRALTVLWPAGALLEVRGNTNGKDGVPERTAGATSGPRSTGSQRTTPVTIGQTTAQLTEETQPSAAGRRDPPEISVRGKTREDLITASTRCSRTGGDRRCRQPC